MELMVPSRRLIVVLSAIVLVLSLVAGLAAAGTGFFGLANPDRGDVGVDEGIRPDLEPAEDPAKEAPSKREPGRDEASDGAPAKEEGAEPKPDRTPPKLEITHPEPGAHLSEKALEFKGVTEPGASVRAGDYRAHVDRKGHWSILLVLSPGGNRARFTAKDRAGNQAHESITVYLDVPREREEDPKEDEGDALEFTAHQKFGSCGEDPPYDIFYGTGVPGSEVSVDSEYGSGDTTVGDGGHWDLKVTFPGAPVGETFLVKVSSSEGGEKHFEFKRTG
jgi:hypothetical protein